MSPAVPLLSKPRVSRSKFLSRLSPPPRLTESKSKMSTVSFRRSKTLKYFRVQTTVRTNDIRSVAISGRRTVASSRQASNDPHRPPNPRVWPISSVHAWMQTAENTPPRPPHPAPFCTSTPSLRARVSTSHSDLHELRAVGCLILSVEALAVTWWWPRLFPPRRRPGGGGGGRRRHRRGGRRSSQGAGAWGGDGASAGGGSRRRSSVTSSRRSEDSERWDSEGGDGGGGGGWSEAGRSSAPSSILSFGGRSSRCALARPGRGFVVLGRWYVCVGVFWSGFFSVLFGSVVAD